MKSISGKAVVLGLLLGAVATSAGALEIKNVKAPVRAAPKADLIVYIVGEDYAKADSVRVTIRNIGKVTSESGILFGKNTSQRGSQGEASVSAIKPNGVFNVDLKFTKKLHKGDTLKIIVDSKNHIDESNETNNTKDFVY